MRAKLRQHLRGREQEHAAVPPIFARRDVGFGRGAIGLLDELADLGPAAVLCAALDVAVARFRPIGDDAERHESPTFGGLDCLRPRLPRTPAGPRRVIGRQHQQQRVDSGCGSARREQRRDRDGRRGIRPTGSSTIACGSMPISRDCVATSSRCAALQTTIGGLHTEPERARSKQRLLKQRRRVDERQELLRPRLAR